MAICGIIAAREEVNLFCNRVARTSTKIPSMLMLGNAKSPRCSGETIVAFSHDGYGQSPDGTIHVVLSGEIANRDEFVSLVPTGSNSLLSDAELFAVLFLKYGEDCLKKINGQVCAAVWDHTNSELSLFLDRVGGIKTLYYAVLPNGLIFASNLNSLLASPSIRREINTPVLRQLFASGFILPPSTLVKGVSKVCPGEQVLYAGNSSVSRKILDRVVFDSSPREKRSPEELKEILIMALRRRTDEPETGFLLSGGIDSSTLVALMAQGIGRNVQTYTAAFPGSSLDESPYARCVAENNNCPNESIVLSKTDALDDLPEIVWHLGEPFLDFSAIPTFHLFKEIRSKTPFVISGDGPDHLFGRYYPLATKRYVSKHYPQSVRLLASLPGSFAGKIQRAGKASLEEAYRGLFALPAWGYDEADSLLGLLTPQQELSSEGNSYLNSISIPEEKGFHGYFDAIATLDFYLDGSFGVFAKIGRMADSQNLTVREPYLDREASDFIAQLPLCQKQSGTLLHLLTSRSHAKYLLKFGLAPQILPEKVIKKNKGGFTPPLGNWLKDTVCTVPVDRLLCNTVKELGLFDPSVIERMLHEHYRDVRDWSRIIFLILSFDLWVRLYIETEHDSFPGWKLNQLYA